MRTVAVIGCGGMGSALARHFVKKGAVLLVGRDKVKTEHLAKEIGATSVSLHDAAHKASILVLAIKPKDLALVASEIAKDIKEHHIMISILAGTPLSTLRKRFPKGKIVRVMPNLAVTVGKGIIGIVDDSLLEPETKVIISSLLEGAGLLYSLPETKMEAFTALCGSSPAFIYAIFEAMMEAGVSMGFTFNDSQQLVLEAFEGSIAFLKASGKHPSDLKIQVASPGGTTIAGLKEMEERGVKAGIWNTLISCQKRGIEMLGEHSS